MSVELKIKHKHLALEPAIIRKEEQKILKQIRSGYCNDTMKAYGKYLSLHNHRKIDVRYEARATHLARAYLTGIPYEKLEKKIHDKTVFKALILPRVYRMVAKYQEKPLQKRWNREKNMLTYNDEEFTQLQNAIKAWCNI